MRWLHKILLWSFVTLVVVHYVFGLLAPYIHPRHSELLYFSGLGFPIILVLFSITCIYLSLRYKVYMLLLTLIPGLISFLKYVALGMTASAASSDSLQVYTFNAHTGYQLDEYDGELDRWRSYITDSSHLPDVFCLQERPDKIEPLLPKATRRYEHGMKSNLHITSSTKMVRQGEVKDESGLRFAIYADMAHEKDTLRVYAFHLSSNRVTEVMGDDKEEAALLRILKNFGPTRAKIYQSALRRAEQANRLCHHVASSPYPCILTGDMNETCQSFTYRRTKGDLKDAFRRAEWGIHPTYRSNPRWVRIDYIFVDPDLEVYDYEVLPFRLSDHYVLHAEVGMK